MAYPKGLEWEVRSEGRDLYLTFDDGPIPEATYWVLELLQNFNVKATFFCVGENVAKHPEVYQAVVDAGHAIGNHTYHHVKAWKTDSENYMEEVRLCNKQVESKLFRPPHGQMTRKLASQLRTDYRIIMWTALSGDFDRRLSGDDCLRNAVRHTKAGAILVFHDSIKALPRLQSALPRYIEHCLAEGFRFKTLI